MLRALSPMTQRVIAVALAAGVVAAVGLLLIGPLVSRVSALQQSIDQERMLLGRLQALASAPEDTGLDNLAQLLPSSGLAIAGGSEAIRQAKLQEQLSAVISGNGVNALSMHALPPRERNGLNLIGLQLQVAAPIEKLQQILIAIEDHRLALFVDLLHVIPSGASIVRDDQKPDILEARIDVFAVDLRQ